MAYIKLSQLSSPCSALYFWNKVSLCSPSELWLCYILAWPSLASNVRLPCLSLPFARISGVCYCSCTEWCLKRLITGVIQRALLLHYSLRIQCESKTIVIKVSVINATWYIASQCRFKMLINTNRWCSSRMFQNYLASLM